MIADLVVMDKRTNAWDMGKLHTLWIAVTKSIYLYISLISHSYLTHNFV
jgi:hypothetical protein